MNRVKVTIGGTEYTVASEDNPSHVLEVARTVDARMKELMDGNSRLSVTMAAVLCAMDAVDVAKKATADADNLRVQLKRSLDENDALRSQVSTGQLRF